MGIPNHYAAHEINTIKECQRYSPKWVSQNFRQITENILFPEALYIHCRQLRSSVKNKLSSEFPARNLIYESWRSYEAPISEQHWDLV